MARARRRRRSAPADTPNRQVEQPGGSQLDIDDAIKFIYSANVSQLHGLHGAIDERLQLIKESSGKEPVKHPRATTGSFANLLRYVRTAVHGEIDQIKQLDAAVCERLTKAGM